MNLEDMIKLIQAVSDSSLSKFDLEEGNLKLSMMTDKMPVPVLQAVVSNEIKGGESGFAPQVNPAPFVSAQTVESKSQAADTTSANSAAVVTAAADSSKEAEISSDNIVKSPLVGTFYNASAPEAEPFAKVGDTVKKGQILGIIEAMKLMNEIESEFDGVVEAVMVENEQVVEYGQPLFRIR